MSPLPLRDASAALTALLRYVHGVRDHAVAEILARAEDERRTLLATARRRAREQVRRTWLEERRDAEAQLRVAAATAQARVRRARQALTLAALGQAWPRIEAAVHERWRAPAARKAWVALALAEAARSLPPGSWRLEHPATWDPAEAQEAVTRLRSFREGVAVEPQARAELSAGVRITCGPAELDASAAGLLRDRAHVAGRWLAELERVPPAAAVRSRT